MTKIYLIRHTQAEGNLYRMMQGHWDGDVTELGLAQVEALAKRFDGIQVDAVYSSDLYRAKLTASAITRSRALPLHTDVRLREINMGPWETQFFGNVYFSQPQETEYFVHDPQRWKIDGAETFEQVGERAFTALTEISQRHPEQSVAVVSHGVTIRCLLSKITGIPLTDTQTIPICKNTAISTVIYDIGSFTVEKINDYDHTLPLAQPSWGNTADLRDESFDPQSDPKYYQSCYADAWAAAHGSLAGYWAQPYLLSAEEHFKRDKNAVVRIYDGDESVGLVDMDTHRGESEGYGWISLFYLKQEYRGKGYGIQLLGRAIKRYKELGRKSLRLHVAQENTEAVDFYGRHGFRILSGEDNALGTLLLMEKTLVGGRIDV